MALAISVLPPKTYSENCGGQKKERKKEKKRKKE
jgi:hypothetical protein